MLGRVKNGGAAPLPSDDWRDHGMRWVAEPRRHAPGLDSLLSWAYRLGASRIAFQTGHSPTIRVHGRNRRVGQSQIEPFFTK